MTARPFVHIRHSLKGGTPNYNLARLRNMTTHRELQFAFLLAVASCRGLLLPEMTWLNDVDHVDLTRKGLLWSKKKCDHMTPKENM